MAGEYAEPEGTVQALGIAASRANVQHRGNAAAVAYGDGTFVQFDIVHHVGVECRKDAEEMPRIVDGAAVEQYEVLVGRAAANVESAGRFTYRLYAGQGEHGLYDVTLAECRGDVRDCGLAELLEAHAGPAVVGHAFGGHIGALQGGNLLAHHYIEFAGGVDNHVDVHVFHGILPESQQVFSCREGEGVAAFFVGVAVVASAAVRYEHRPQGFSGSDVPYYARHLGPAFAGAFAPYLVGFVAVAGDHGFLLDCCQQGAALRGRLVLGEPFGGQFVACALQGVVTFDFTGYPHFGIVLRRDARGNHSPSAGFAGMDTLECAALYGVVIILLAEVRNDILAVVGIIVAYSAHAVMVARLAQKLLLALHPHRPLAVLQGYPEPGRGLLDAIIAQVDVADSVYCEPAREGLLGSDGRRELGLLYQ